MSHLGRPNWSALFAIKYVNLYQQPGSNKLITWTIESILIYSVWQGLIIHVYFYIYMILWRKIFIWISPYIWSVVPSKDSHAEILPLVTHFLSKKAFIAHAGKEDSDQPMHSCSLIRAFTVPLQNQKCSIDWHTCMLIRSFLVCKSQGPFLRTAHHIYRDNSNSKYGKCPKILYTKLW